MRTVTYRLADLSRAMIQIGLVGENNYTRVVFDSTTVFDEYPGAIPALTIAPPVGQPYPAVATREGNLVVWTVADSDLVSSGLGKAQLTFTENGVVCKSCVAKLLVERSITASGEAPDPVEDWLVAANTALNAIPQTIDNALAAAKESGEFDGEDGYSPSATVTKTGDTATITITDKSGTTTATVTDGQKGDPGDPGEPGSDGVSPTVAVAPITGGHEVSITDATGAHSFDVMNGDPGQPGQPGADGHSPVITTSKSGKTTTILSDGQSIGTVLDGNDGQDGQPGADGYSPSASVSKSGATATITITDKNGTTTATVSDGTPVIDDTTTTATDKVWSAKKSADEVSDLNSAIGAKYTKPASGIPASDLESGVIPSVPVQDVQVNGVSVMNQGVANVPVASSDAFGAVKIGTGLYKNASDKLSVDSGSDTQFKLGVAASCFVSPQKQHAATFFGLAKAAGDSTQSASSNAVGTYTDDAKIAIQKMLGIYQAPWELIREDTVTNATEAEHIITVDGNGQAFELTDVRMWLAYPTQNNESKWFGMIELYNGETIIKQVSFDTFTHAENANPCAANVSVTQEHGMILQMNTSWSNSGVLSNIRWVAHPTSTDTRQPFTLSPEVSFKKIRFQSIKGTLTYRLYGKRKWT